MALRFGIEEARIRGSIEPGNTDEGKIRGRRREVGRRDRTKIERNGKNQQGENSARQ